MPGGKENAVTRRKGNIWAKKGGGKTKNPKGWSMMDRGGGKLSTKDLQK